MVGGDDDLAFPRVAQGRGDPPDHLPLGHEVRFQEPPRGVQEDEAQVVAHVHHGGPSGAGLGQQLHRGAGLALPPLVEEDLEPLQAMDPLQVPLLPPVVVSRHEQPEGLTADGLGSGDHGHLGRHPGRVLGVFRFIPRVHSVGIDDVPQHDHGDRRVPIQDPRPRVHLLPHPGDDRVRLHGRHPGIPHQEDDALHTGGVRPLVDTRIGQGAVHLAPAPGQQQGERAQQENGRRAGPGHLRRPALPVQPPPAHDASHRAHEHADGRAHRCPGPLQPVLPSQEAQGDAQQDSGEQAQHGAPQGSPEDGPAPESDPPTSQGEQHDGRTEPSHHVLRGVDEDVQEVGPDDHERQGGGEPHEESEEEAHQHLAHPGRHGQQAT